MGQAQWLKLRLNQCSRRTVKQYKNVDQSHIDEKYDAVLCVSGRIKYVLLEDTGFMLLWLKEYMELGVMASYERYITICDVLALALLWP
jgi:hypothetical protein